MGLPVRTHPVPIVLAVLAVAGTTLLAGCGDDGDGGAPAQATPGDGDLVSVLRSKLHDLDLGRPPKAKVPGPRFRLARVRPGRRVELLDAPGGRVITRLGHRTEFGSTRTFWIARSQGDWFGVHVPELPNGELGWIQYDAAALHLLETHYWIVADTSAQLLELRYRKRVLNRIPVTVGSPGSPTPLGDYSITDGLAGRAMGPYYGCCVLALTGHQPNLPPHWLGGDRIAIHGTPGSVGGANSGGCLRASNRDMVQLFARVPLGAPVFVRG